MKEAILLTDGYKLDHRRQYPENTEYVYSNWTPRKGIATLSENYKGVYFTNSYRDWGREALPDNVKVIEVV